MKSFSNENRRIISELTSDIESILEADTGDLKTWDAKKDGLTASVEFVDPNSSKYKYVAYYSDTSKEVDHFLVTYDQHTNAHHSTEKTLKWDDSRQTRKQAYNSLICSDTVKNKLKLKPKQGSDAECVVPAKSAAKIAPAAQKSTQNRSASVSTAPQEKEIDKTNAENICSVSSKVIGRTTILDFSNCPITPDTISNPRGISFPSRGITRIAFKKKDNGDQSPYLDTELRTITFNISKKDRSQRSSFNNYFNYLRRVMAHVVKEGWVITGDLDSFPRFTVAYKNSVNEEIEKDIDDIIEILLEKSNFRSGGGKAGFRSGSGKSRLGGGSSGGSSFRGGGYSGVSSMDSSGQTFAKITNRNAGSRLESQNINPGAMSLFKAFWSALKAKGYEPFVTSGQRMPSHQRDLRDSGKGSMTAQPCRSDHQYGFALDINVNLPPDKDGKVVSARMKSSDATWEPIVAIAKAAGLSWQGSKDRVHFYVRGKVTQSMKNDCEAFFGDINIKSSGVASAMKAKEEENPSEINKILKIV